MIPAPVKPFDSYRWRWASLTPSEGLNEPPVFLGVLRAMHSCEGQAKNSEEFENALRKIEEELQGRVSASVTLARDPERNLLRNSGQYWEALDLLAHVPGTIDLTDLGRRVATGGVARAEFAAATINSLSLPNLRVHVEDDWREWLDSGLRINPLRLVLEVMTALASARRVAEAHLSVDELIRIVIPLAGESASVEKHVQAIAEHRAGTLDLIDWPDCAPGANDERMAHEFLLFLHLNGYLDLVDEGATRRERRYGISDLLLGEIEGLLAEEPDPTPADSVARRRQDQEPLFVERRRVLVDQIFRPGQMAFRRSVLAGYGHSCIITGEKIVDVLEAAHIIHVRYRGADDIANGLCLRSDIHTLFDAGHLRIHSDGRLSLSEPMQTSTSYSGLEAQVALPGFVSAEALEWRWNYG